MKELNLSIGDEKLLFTVAKALASESRIDILKL